MKGYLQEIKKRAKTNTDFRQVLDTGKHLQTVIMSIPVGGEIGEEVHKDNDQMLYLVDGYGEVVLDGVHKPFRKGDMVVVHAGTQHNFINKDTDEPMQIITVYGPPHHPDGTIHHTKEESDHAGY